MPLTAQNAYFGRCLAVLEDCRLAAWSEQLRSNEGQSNAQQGQSSALRIWDQSNAQQGQSSALQDQSSALHIWDEAIADYVEAGLLFVSPDGLAEHGPWCNFIDHSHAGLRKVGQRYADSWANAWQPSNENDHERLLSEKAQLENPKAVHSCAVAMMNCLLKAACWHVCLAVGEDDVSSRAAVEVVRQEVNAVGLTGAVCPLVRCSKWVVRG